MKITISGALGSGKSTIAKLLAKKLNLKHYSTGDFMRKLAAERNLTILELNNIAVKEDWVDKELDERQIKFGIEEDNFVIDGRLSWHFIKDSIKIYLDVSDEVAAKRIWLDLKNRETESPKSIEKLMEEIKERKQKEIERYLKKYNINHHDKSNYDLVIDTTSIPIEKVIEKILNYLKNKKLINENST